MNTFNLQRFSFVCLSVSLILSILVMFGWHYNIQSLIQPFTTVSSMKLNTAIGIALLSLAGMDLTLAKTMKNRIPVQVISVVVIVLSSVILAQHFWGFDFQIDEYFVADRYSVGTRWAPGRPSIVTLINFLFISFAILGFTIPFERIRKLSHGLIFVSWVISFQSLVSYVEGVNVNYGLAIFTQIAVHTAFAFFMICNGILLSRPQEGIMKIVSSKTEAGKIGRSLLFFAVFLPPSIAWIQLTGERLGFWNEELGAILRIVLQVIFFSWIAFRTGATLLESQSKERVHQQSLEKAIQSRDEFLSIASHELRTPIMAMMLQSSLLRRNIAKAADDPSHPKTLRLIEQTEEGLTHMTKLVEEMLDISRIQSGRLSLKLAKIDLNELTQATLQRFSTQLSTAGITVQVDSLGPTWVSADRFRVEQVLNNLITNAIRYAANAPMTVTISTQNPFAKLVFQDHGAGIEAADVEKIFSRFERLISANEVSGLGLGLYIARQIVEGHQGSLYAESELGKGTRFIMMLPLEMDKT